MAKTKTKLPIGPRTVKTALAVILAMTIVEVYGATSSKLIFAMLGAMAAIEPTFKKSREACVSQILGVILGALGGVLLRYLSLPMLLSVGLGIILVITFYNGMRIPHSPSLACLIVVMVCTEPDIQPISYALSRIWDSAIGLGVGLLINTLILPYDNSRQIRVAMRSLDRELIAFLEDMFDGDDHLPNSESMKKRTEEIYRLLTVFSNQLLPFKRKKHKKQLEHFQLCEKKARQLVSRLEVLSQMERPGRLSGENYRLLLANGAQIPASVVIHSKSKFTEFDTVLNYHVRRILGLRRELLAALAGEETLDIRIHETGPDDLPHLLTLWNNGDVMKYVGFPEGLDTNMEKLQEWYTRLEDNRPVRNHYSIYLPNGSYCGESFYEIDYEHDRAAALDIKLMPEVRGRGIATDALAYAIWEAFTQGATKVWVDPNPANSKARALYRRLGFQEKPMPDYLADEADSVDFTPLYMELTREDAEAKGRI